MWTEICKGRIIELNKTAGVASGEIYVGRSSKAALEAALSNLKENDYLEIDQYGASAKVLSGLTEYFLVEMAITTGYSVQRLPEDMAQHLGEYSNYDYALQKGRKKKKVEVKSLWGTDTTKARLIHSKGTNYPTSSCKFVTQDIFAVSLFLRTGNIRDFAFARSVPDNVKPYGLPPAEKFPEHVHQNPPCEIGDGSWFETIDEVWKLK